MKPARDVPCDRVTIFCRNSMGVVDVSVDFPQDAPKPPYFFLNLEHKVSRFPLILSLNK